MNISQRLKEYLINTVKLFASVVNVPYGFAVCSYVTHQHLMPQNFFSRSNVNFVIINRLLVLQINVKDTNRCAVEDSRRHRYSFNFSTRIVKKVH
jgi:hypothetical protein